MRVEVSDEPPPLDLNEWDHVVEVPLTVPSGMLHFEASGGGATVKTGIPPGVYRARLSGRGYLAGVGKIEGHESYQLQLWPAKEAKPRLIKYWHGYDACVPVGKQDLSRVTDACLGQCAGMSPDDGGVNGGDEENHRLRLVRC